MRKTIKYNVVLNGLCLTELLDLSDVEVRGNFNCHSNNLTSLEGAPKTVGGDFKCHSNNLTSLEGAPKTVGGAFLCDDNNLTSLSGGPVTVGGNFNCRRNKLTSLEGIPKTINDHFIIDESLKDRFPEESIRRLCEIKGGVVYF